MPPPRLRSGQALKGLDSMSFPHDFRPDVSDEVRTTFHEKRLLIKDDAGYATRRRVPRILVVDDHPSIAGLMSQLLTLRGL